MDETVQDITAEDQLAHDPAAGVGADALVSEDELAAALSEIESAAKAIGESQVEKDAETPPEAAASDEPPAERAPNDGLTSPDASTTDVSSPAECDLPEQTAAGANAESEPDIGADPEDDDSVDVAPNAPFAGDISASNALLDEDELAAALAEIEKAPHREREQIPSLDDGQAEPDDPPQIDLADEQDGQEAADEPAPGSTEDCESDSPEEVVSTEADVAESPPDAPAGTADAAPAKPKVRFAIGKKNTGENDGDDSAPVDPVESARAALADPRTPPVVKKLVRTLDQGLETLNRPLARYGDSVRTLVGWCALATIFASLLAMFLLPALLPRRDAITYLSETRARVSSPAPPPAAAGDAENDPS